MGAADRLVVFDVGETLVTGPAGGPAKRIAAQLGLDDGQKRTLHRALMTRPFARASDVTAFVRNTLGIDGPTVEATVNQVWCAQEHDATPIDGVDRVIRDLGEHGYALGLVSNIWAPYLLGVLNQLGVSLKTHVPAANQVYSFRAGEMKPSATLFTRVLGGAGVPAERAIMIGDSYSNDIEPAAAVGMKTIWTLHRPEKERGSLVRALNQAGPMPSRTVASIAAVDVDLVRSLIGDQ